MKPVTSHEHDAIAWGVSILCVGMILFMSQDALAASNFSDYVNTNIGTNFFGFKSGLNTIATLAGTAGAGISGWTLYQNVQDGGQIKENVGAVMGLVASMGLLGFTGFTDMLTATAK